MSINLTRIDVLLAEIDDLPTLPTIVSKLLELLENPKSQARQIAELITSDQALSAKVLKMVNSAFLGLPSKISSVNQAVVILGFAKIRSLVLSAAVIDLFRGNDVHQGYFAPLPFWTHAIAAAAGAQQVAVITEAAKGEDAFTAGLLHGVGLIVLDQFIPDVMQRMQEHVEIDDWSLHEAAESEMGFDHAMLGARLLEGWDLPNSIINAVRFHTFPHASPEADRTLTACVHVGDIFSRVLGYGSAGEPRFPALDKSALATLGLTPSSFPVILEPMDQSMERASQLLSLTMG